MLKIFRNIGNKIWKKDKQLKKTITKKRKRKKNLNKAELTKEFFNALHKEVEKNGYRSIKISTIMKKTGIGKRTNTTVEKLLENFKKEGLFTQPKFSKDLPLKEVIKIYSFPVLQLGELFEKEKQLEDYIDQKELYRELNIDTVERQFTPNHSRDRLDFKGENKNEIVVLELKNRGGGKSAVEQVLRYAELLKMQYPDTKIRKILVTGIQNYETALVVKGMKKEEYDNFEWYLYKYISARDFFEFVRVKSEDLEDISN